MLQILGIVAEASEALHLLQEGLVPPDLTEALAKGSEESEEEQDMIDKLLLIRV